MALLWPDREEERARHLLRDALYRLREVLGDHAIQAGGEGLRLDPSVVRCDLWDFEDALDARDWSAADRAYGGVFLDGLNFTGSPEFDHWVDGQRQRLVGLHRVCLDALACTYEGAHDLRALVSVRRRLFDLDPLSTQATLRLMEALEVAGDRHAALLQAADHERRLAAELDTSPDAEVRAYADRLRHSARGATIAAAAEKPAISSPVTKDAVERRHEFRWLHSWRRHVVATVGLGLGAAAWWFATRPSAKHLEKDTPRSLIVTDFGAAPLDSTLSRLVTEAIRVGLQQSSLVRIAPPEGIANALRRLRRSPSEAFTLAIAREIAQRDPVDAIVDGDLTRSGQGWLLTVRLVDPDSGAILQRIAIASASETGLLLVADRAARRLRRALGEPRAGVRASPPLADVTTASLPALRLYTEGMRANDRVGDFSRAVSLLRQAVVIDTMFASAWRKLAAAYVNARLGTPEERDEAITRAFRYRDRLTEPERLHAEGTWFWGRDRERAIDVYSTLAAADSSLGLNNMARILQSRREFHRAEFIQRAVTRHNPDASIAHTGVVDLLMNLGRFSEADSAMAETRRRFPGSASVLLVAASVECHRDPDSRTCIRLLDSLSTSASSDIAVRSLLNRQQLALRRGQVRLADSLERLAARADSARGAASWRWVSLVRQVRWEVLIRERPAVARRILRAGRPLHARDSATAAVLYAQAGDVTTARFLLAALVRDSARLLPLDRSALREIGAEIDLASGRWQQALAGFRRADQLSDGPRNACIACLTIQVARTFDRGHATDSAIAGLERFLAEATFPRLELDALHLASTYQRLAELYESAGDRSAAIANYRRLAALWHDADEDLQPRVREALRRASALSSVAGSR